jgi:hypothetical protein
MDTRELPLCDAPAHTGEERSRDTSPDPTRADDEWSRGATATHPPLGDDERSLDGAVRAGSEALVVTTQLRTLTLDVGSDAGESGDDAVLAANGEELEGTLVLVAREAEPEQAPSVEGYGPGPAKEETLMDISARLDAVVSAAQADRAAAQADKEAASAQAAALEEKIVRLMEVVSRKRRREEEDESGAGPAICTASEKPKGSPGRPPKRKKGDAGTCNVCGRHAKSLRRHKYNNHRGAEYICAVTGCDYKALQLCNLKQHLYKLHNQ